MFLDVSSMAKISKKDVFECPAWSNGDLPFYCAKLFLLHTKEVFKGTQYVKNLWSVFLSHLHTEITQSLWSNNDILVGNHDTVCLVMSE